MTGRRGGFMSFRIREYHPADTDAVLELWEKAKSTGYEPVYGLAEVLGLV
jgi:hypothetical protein